MGTEDRTKAYLKRRSGEGKSKRDVMRSLKRYVAREVWGELPGMEQLAVGEQASSREDILESAPLDED